MNLVVSFMVLILTSSIASAGTYYYTGVSNTIEVATMSTATLMMSEHPTCARTECHALAWTVLWNTKSNQYVEVGIGYSPRWACTSKKNSVGLWWASPTSPAGERVACVAKGTYVTVTVKYLGNQLVQTTWEWNGNILTRTIQVPGWFENIAIHPTKVEVYAKYNNFPKPVDITVLSIDSYPIDSSGILQQTFPYMLIDNSTLRSFRVKY